jgi:hypothetical protein
MYELAVGIPAFDGTNPEEVKKNVLKGKYNQIPVNLYGSDVVELIYGLLEKVWSILDNICLCM